MATQTLAQQFAAEYARGVVPGMLKTIRNTKRFTWVILAGVLAISYPHQGMYLYDVRGVGWLGWVIPAVIDVALLTMVNIIQTPGMAKAAKRAAIVMLVFLGLLSGGINVAAPAVLMARVIFGAIVAVAIGIKIVGALVKPDFAAIETAEARATEATAPVKDPKRSAAAKQAAATRKANSQAKEADAEARRERRRLAAQLRRLEAGQPLDEIAGPLAPVSPAPAA